MKITKIDLLHSEPVEDGWRPIFVRVYTDEGIYGDGEVALSYGGIDNAAFGMLQDMAYLYEAAVQIHVCGSPLVVAASLQLEAAIPGFIIHEYNVNTEMPKMLGLTTRTYEPVNGQMPVPDLPGIGNEIAPSTFEHSDVVHVG